MSASDSKQETVESARSALGYVTYDSVDAETLRAESANCPMVCRDSRPRRGVYVRIEDCGSKDASYMGRVIDGPFFTENPGAYYMLELICMVVDGKRTAVQSRPDPGSAITLLPSADVRALIGAVGDYKLGRLLGQRNIEIALDSTSLNRHVGIFGTTGTGKSNSLQVIVEEISRSHRSALVFDIEGEYVSMNEPTDTLTPLLAEYKKKPEGLKNLEVYVPAPNSSRNMNAKKFGIPFADIDLEIFSEVLGLSPYERVYMFDIARKTKEVSGNFHAYEIKSILSVLKKRIDAQVDNPSLPELVAEAHMGLFTKLSFAQRSGIVDAHTEMFERLSPDIFCVPGRVSVIDLSESSDIVRNICIAHLLKEIFRYKTRHRDSCSIMIFLEEIHTFLSKAKIQTMTATLTMLTEMARQGRKRGIGLGLVSQQPALVPSELVELCNTRLMHRISSEPNIATLRNSTGNVPDALWAVLPSLANGEALISSPKYSQAIVAQIRPNMSKRLRTENS